MTKVPGSLFDRVPAIKNIHFVDSITEIGRYAFAQAGVENVDVPKGLEKIGEKAFAECNSMRYILLPNNIKELGDEVFYKNTNVLVAVNYFSNNVISDNNEHLLNIP